MAGTVRTRIDREGVGIRPFPPTAYPPPSPWSPRREGKKETWTEIKQKERGGGGRRDATRRRIVCDFVLPLAATSRSRSSISHTSVPSRGRRPRRDRTRVHTYACTECVCVCVWVCVKERKVAWNPGTRLSSLRSACCSTQPMCLSSLPLREGLLWSSREASLW